MPKRRVVITPDRGIEQGLVDRLRSTWPLVVTWTRRANLKARYRQSIFRSGWSLLQPLAILVTYGWVLTAVLDIPTEEVPYLTFAWAGIVPYTFFAQCLGQGVGSIQQAGGIISRVYFPREVLPLSVVGGAAVDHAIMVVTLVGAAWVQVGPPSVYLLGLVPVFVVLLVWSTAATLLASALTVFRRDLNFAVPLALRVFFIVTPVMYPASLIEAQAPILVDANPIAAAVEGTRAAVYRQAWPDMTWLGAQAFLGTVFLAVAFVVFRRLEPRMSDAV